MNTKVIGITKPVIEGLETPGELVSYAARVSNPSNQNNKLTAPKLLQYLIKHKHWSPFEIVNIVIEIETTRDIARQILRHRSFSFQEFSQRYADPTGDLGFIIRETRFQDTKNRQNSIPLDLMDDLMTASIIADEWAARQKAIIDVIQENYKWAINSGIAKEQARAILPEGLTLSRMYVNGTLRSWIHYCHLRMGPETQKEHREIAQSCWNHIIEYYPELSDIIIGE